MIEAASTIGRAFSMSVLYAPPSENDIGGSRA
jgi:hypothetical protein